MAPNALLNDEIDWDGDQIANLGLLNKTYPRGLPGMRHLTACLRAVDIMLLLGNRGRL